MLNKFCFDVYAQKSLFRIENVNGFFGISSSTPSPVSLEFIELVPSKKKYAMAFVATRLSVS